MLLLLFAGCRAAFAPGAGLYADQDSRGAGIGETRPAGSALDRQVTVVGRDQAAIPIPRPLQQEQVSVPTIDMDPPACQEVPVVAPPAAGWSEPRAEVLIPPLLTDGRS